MSGVIFDFAKYAGREVRMIDSVLVRKFNSTGEEFRIPKIKLDENDPVIRDLSDDCRAAGLKLRIMVPGLPLTMDYQAGRANIRIEKAPDGKWRIAEKMTFG